MKGQLLLTFFVLLGLGVLIPPLGAVLTPILVPIGGVILLLNLFGR